MGAPLLVRFLGGMVGRWRVVRAGAAIGAPMPAVTHIEVCEGGASTGDFAPAWVLRGVTSHQRYVERAEGAALRALQAGLGRPEATLAAMIPITKSDAWWDLAQDERRAIFEQRSKHIAATLKYLPAIARRLHHARDLGEGVDFITWFEFAPEHEALFEELVGLLRATEEWTYVIREVDFRLLRE
jgi:chlorite dismutase